MPEPFTVNTQTSWDAWWLASRRTRYAQFGITGLMPSVQLCRMLVGGPASVLVSALAVVMRSA